MFDIARFLPNNEYQAAINSNSPSAINPFATINDLGGGTTTIYNGDDTLTGNRLVSMANFTLGFSGGNTGFIGGETGTALTVKNGTLVPAWSIPSLILYNGNPTNDNYGKITFTNNQYGAVISTNNESGIELIRLSATTNNPSFIGSSLSVASTNLPQAQLEVNGMVRSLSKAPPVLSSGKSIEFYFNASSDQGRILGYDRDLSLYKDMVIGNGISPNKFTIFASGNVGIGTEVETGSKLSVQAISNGTEKALVIRNNTNVSDLFKVQGNGRVAIGNVTPTSMLTVNGDVETLTNSKGFVVLDRTNGNRYRIYTDNGILYTELVV